jgi:hypothetical protein
MDDSSPFDYPVGPLPSLEEELVNSTFAELFPNGLPKAKGRSKLAASQSPFEDTYELEVKDLAALVNHVQAGAALGVTTAPLKSVRHTHHKLAQLLAIGVDETDAALMCNFSTSRVSFPNFSTR